MKHRKAVHNEYMYGHILLEYRALISIEVTTAA